MKNLKLMTHIVAGYPSLKESEKIAEALIDAGTAFLEIQIPFSDPIADGKTILDANTKALELGVTVEDCFELLKKLKQKTEIPILFMTYFNVIFRYGIEKFCAKAKKYGAYGLIVPDIPFDEEKNNYFLQACKSNGLKAIQVISPITKNDRLQEISKIADGFVYCVSRFGTTGAREKLETDLDKYLARVRKYIKLPLALGFGISNKKQVQLAASKADIVVIGSAVINKYNQSKSNKTQAIRDFVLEFCEMFDCED